MSRKNLSQLVNEQKERSKKKYSKTPKLTEEQVAAIDKFADKKNELFDKILSSPEQLKKVKRMLNA